MKTFIFKMFIKTSNNLEFIIGQKTIKAINYDTALNLFNKMELPFHHFALVDGDN